MKFEDLNNLDPNNIGAWPIPVKATVIVIVCIVVLLLGYFLDIQGQQDKLARAKRTELQLKTDFESKQAKAASLDKYKAQMKEMEASFGTMLRQLPSKTEVEELLIDISQTGLASGVEFQLFKPQGERYIDFYAEYPISMKLTGTYHQFGDFVSGVAALPRIVTLHNISISPGKDGKLTMQVTAKTYRYLDENEISKAQQKGKNKRGRR